MTLTEGLVALLARPVAAADRARAALHVLDWIGCAAAGAAEEAGPVFRAHAATEPGPARILLGGGATARMAALANGALGNVLEMDDVHREAILHAGPVVVPAALALAAAHDAPGEALLDAVLRGYEAEIRLGRALGPAHYARFHPSATCGPFGAAAACASLLGLDAARMADALGNAASVAGGLWRCRHEPGLTKQWHTAHAAAAGLEAALLAAQGMTGPRAILEGAQGLFEGFSPDARPGRVLDGADAPWLIHETSFKPWPACRHAHPAIDAALLLRDGLAGQMPERVEVAAYADAITFCDRAEPRSTIEAKFSLQHAVAVALLDGPPPLAAFAPQGIARADIAALRARISVRADAALSAAYPAHFGAGVAILLPDGQRLEARVADALGDPENPLAPEAVIGKARALMAHAGVAPARSEAAIAAALALAEGGAARACNDALP
ncbi:MmgE/PrpD family protein [Roseomonas sp. HF4]|uniref:MmgE/PrpD family protein n=1 Tax=Roseomonas sp. HF4 TaxID=2562313 RepID=UPI0010BF776B|nr:MmgE/PrpD family protein [Roseomonas sp. HF4]